MTPELFAELRDLAERCMGSPHSGTRRVGACLGAIVGAVFAQRLERIADAIQPVTRALLEEIETERLASMN